MKLMNCCLYPFHFVTNVVFIPWCQWMLGMILKPTNARKCMEVYYTRCIPPTCFGHSCGYLQGATKTCRRYTVCIIHSIHLCAFVGFDIITDCSVHGYGSFKIDQWMLFIQYCPRFTCCIHPTEILIFPIETVTQNPDGWLILHCSIVLAVKSFVNNVLCYLLTVTQFHMCQQCIVC